MLWDAGSLPCTSEIHEQCENQVVPSWQHTARQRVGSIEVSMSSWCNKRIYVFLSSKDCHSFSQQIKYSRGIIGAVRTHHLPRADLYFG